MIKAEAQLGISSKHIVSDDASARSPSTQGFEVSSDKKDAVSNQLIPSEWTKQLNGLSGESLTEKIVMPIRNQALVEKTLNH